MIVQNHITDSTHTASELDQLPQLYAVLGIVEQIASNKADTVDIPDEMMLRSAYENTSGIAKKGFGDIAAETVAAATTGARALVGKGEDATVAAEELALYLRRRIAQLGRFVGV